MRIAFCGASGTGKTTIAKVVSQRLNLPLNPVGSRSVASEMGYESPYDVDAFGRRSEFQHKLFKFKKEWEYKNKSFVTDRTHIDNLAYSIVHDCVGTVTPEFIEDVLRNSLNYTHIFLFPVSSFLKTEQDKSRLHDINYHLVYEWILKMILDQTGIQYKILEEIYIDKRVEEILKCVKS